jgi:hypothetical protein
MGGKRLLSRLKAVDFFRKIPTCEGRGRRRGRDGIAAHGRGSGLPAAAHRRGDARRDRGGRRPHRRAARRAAPTPRPPPET